MTDPLTPPRLLDLLRRSLQTWLAHQPTFATTPATAPSDAACVRRKTRRPIRCLR